MLQIARFIKTLCNIAHGNRQQNLYHKPGVTSCNRWNIRKTKNKKLSDSNCQSSHHTNKCCLMSVDLLYEEDYPYSVISNGFHLLQQMYWAQLKSYWESSFSSASLCVNRSYKPGLQKPFYWLFSCCSKSTWHQPILLLCCLVYHFEEVCRALTI